MTAASSSVASSASTSELSANGQSISLHPMYGSTSDSSSRVAADGDGGGASGPTTSIKLKPRLEDASTSSSTRVTFAASASASSEDDSASSLPLPPRSNLTGGDDGDFLSSTKSHHHRALTVSERQHYQQHRHVMEVSASSFGSDGGVSAQGHRHEEYAPVSGGEDEEYDGAKSARQQPLRRIAIDLSLYVNVIILFAKLVAYIRTLSLSVLAALVDSVLDVVSQFVLNYTERHSTKSRSSALYPAGAARLEPVGVLTCAALMGMASFEVVKESLESVFEGERLAADDEDLGSFWGMVLVVVVKLFLWGLCRKAGQTNCGAGAGAAKQSVCVSDPTLEALAQDHWNDTLSNAVAAVALLFALRSERLWFLDPIGAIAISCYIIWSWYATGKEQIEQLTGKVAPAEFIDELYDIANNFDGRMDVDVCRAYHFGPKFLVELEVVLPRDTLLFESHDLGMELQYEIEGREEVERCFVHIDYESRPYDEHVVSKVPELRAKYRPYAKMHSCHSV